MGFTAVLAQNGAGTVHTMARSNINTSHRKKTTLEALVGTGHLPETLVMEATGEG